MGSSQKKTEWMGSSQKKTELNRLFGKIAKILSE